MESTCWPRSAAAIACVVAIGGVLASFAASGQPPTAQQASAIRASCRSDYIKHCSGVPPGGAASLACLRAHVTEVSPACQRALKAVPAPAPKPAAGAASAAVPRPTAIRDAWPPAVTTQGT